MDDPHLYKEGVDGIIRRSVPEHEQEQILRKCHPEAYGGHHAGDRTTHKVLMSTTQLYSCRHVLGLQAQSSVGQ